MNITDYRSRFGFHAAPFTPEIHVKERFVHEIYDEQIDFLYHTVDKRMSASLIAPAGTGKTALLRALADRLPEARYRVHYIKVTDLSKRDLCREFATAMGIESAGTYPSLVRRLQEGFTGTLDIDGVRPVIFLDEAHDFRTDVLGIIRILTNFEMDSRLVVSIVLAGQPPLAKMLGAPRFEDIRHRLAHNAVLRVLSRKESTQYIKHRCQVAGAASCPFDNTALDALYEIGRGNLRATDQLSLKSLEIAHHEDCGIADGNHVVSARRMLWP